MPTHRPSGEGFAVSYSLGVDLGTTFVAAAVAHDTQVEMFTLGDRSVVSPAAVYAREDGTMVTGDAAVRRAVSSPDRVGREFKRRLGDPTPVILGGSPYAVTALLGTVLRDVVDRVVETEGEQPSRVVLTHPANWGPYRRELFDEVPHLAGLSSGPSGPPRTVTEPEAAAAHYAASRRLDDGDVVAVYDLGGGTFDATVLRKHAGGIEILGSPEGIERLGGVDFDEAILSHVNYNAGGALAELDMGDLQTSVAMARLRQDCVLAKEALSIDSETTIPVFLPHRHFDVRLTTAEFEDLIRAQVESTIGALTRTLRSAQVEPSDLSAVLLVGGSSRIPLVARMISAELGRPIVVDTHPKYAVALGAAELARMDGARDPGQAAPAAAGRPERQTAAPVAAAPVAAAAVPAAALAGASALRPPSTDAPRPAPTHSAPTHAAPTHPAPTHPAPAAAAPAGYAPAGPPAGMPRPGGGGGAPAGMPRPGAPATGMPRPGSPGAGSPAAAPAAPSTGMPRPGAPAAAAPATTIPAASPAPVAAAMPAPRAETPAPPAEQPATGTEPAPVGPGPVGSGTPPPSLGSPSGGGGGGGRRRLLTVAAVAVLALLAGVVYFATGGYGLVLGNGQAAPPATGAPPAPDEVAAAVPIPSLGTAVPAGPTSGFVAVSPNGRLAYVANRAAGFVTVIDTSINRTTATIPIPAGPPQYLAFAPDGSRVYVSIFNEQRTIAAVAVLDTSDNSVVATIPVRTRPYALAVTPDGSKVYVPNHDSGTVSVIDTATDRVSAEIAVAPNPHWIAFSPDGSRAYAANHESNLITVLNTTDNSVLAEVPVGTSPHSVAVNPSKPLVANVNYDSASVSMIDTDTNEVVATVPVGTNPQAIAWSPDGRFAYTANLKDNTVSVISAESYAVTATIPTEDSPTSVGVLPNGKQAYVTNLNSGTLTVLNTSG
ncbi:Hsp70 family protein [Pseudonocardia sediminis]|nr:Hsp70 family protein [Pseudonocardia sediminis]